MNILTIDTTTKKANVSISTDTKTYTKSIDNEITHSEKLLPLIDEVLKQSNLNLKDIDLYACVVGPGSFTGIRIGLATIKAFAKVYSKKIFTVDSLEMFAYCGFKNTDKKIDYVVSLLDARNSRVYYGVFKVVNDNGYVLQNIFPYSNLDINIALEDISKSLQNEMDSCIFFTGNVAQTYKENIEDCFSNCVILDSYLNIEIIPEIISKKSSNTKNFHDYLSLDAIYVRSSEAERTKKGEYNGV